MWNETEKKPIVHFLLLTFSIAWITEGTIILGERLGIITNSMAWVGITTALIGFGAGMAPTYAIIILLKKHGKIRGFKDFCGRVFKAKNAFKTVIGIVVFCCIPIIWNIIGNTYIGNWYLAILTIPIMVFGGGMEEIGWRGFLQPALEEKMPFIAAAFAVGIIWAVWHLPLWLIQNANQSSFNIGAFFLFCIGNSFVFAALHKFTKSVFACIFIHAFSNALGSAFTFDILADTPNIKVIITVTLSIILSIIVWAIVNRKEKVT